MIRIEGTSFVKDGKPFFPVMGEYQYSRSFPSSWKKDMAKMKALGVNVLATYSFWIHHEEIEGEFDFSGQRSLRDFLKAARETGLLVSLRLGPWVHGECRNGGFPDWLLTKGCRLRSNDPEYLKYVRRYFERLFQECEGEFEKDGGPIFAIQVENEYAQWGKEDESYGNVHIRALTALLKEIGFEVPVYLATGWGLAATGDALPVYGGYAAGPWEDHLDKLPPLEGYCFSPNPNDSRIGSDTGVKDVDLSKKASGLPYVTVELGTGIEVTKRRRPALAPIDSEAIALTRLGSGVAALGYYVFHGGIHPDGKRTTMQEYRREGNLDAGFYCDLAEKDYDFQAAMSAYGRVREVGKGIHVLNEFAVSFAPILLSSPSFFPETNAKDPADLSSPRFSCRMKDGSGFLFINNHCRGYSLPSHALSEYLAPLGIEGPECMVRPGDFAILPVKTRLGEAYARFSLATPFLVLNGKDVFFAKTLGSDYFDGDVGEAKLFFLSKEEAACTYKIHRNGRDYAFLCPFEVYETEEGIRVEGTGKGIGKLYPDDPALLPRTKRLGKDGDFGLYEIDFHTEDVPFSVSFLGEKEGKAFYRIDFPNLATRGDVEVEIPFEGDLIEVFVDGKKVDDRFYMGIPYSLCLAPYGYPKAIEIAITPLKVGEPRYLEIFPTFHNGVACRLGNVKVRFIADILL